MHRSELSRFAAAIGILFIFCLCFSGCFSGQNAVDLPETTAHSPLTATEGGLTPDKPADELADGVYVEAPFAWSGMYVEDGSNEPCENVAAVRVVNESDVDYLYVTFHLTAQDVVYHFTASSLMAHSSMTVLDAEKTVFVPGVPLSVEAETIAPFAQAPSLHPETFRITYTDGFLNVKNLTDRPIEHIFIYYKSFDETGYLGGITYRVSFDRLNPGELLQKQATNIHKDSSEVIFVTFEEPSD